MIDPQNYSWLRQVFLFRGSALQRTWKRILFHLAWSMLITILVLFKAGKVADFIRLVDLTPTPFTLLGASMGIFLALRSNASYDRFWEGRKLWGALVNTSRSWSRQIFVYVSLPKELSSSTKQEKKQRRALEAEIVTFRKEMIYRMIAYVHALRLALRDQPILPEIKHLVPDEDIEAWSRQENVPNAMVQRMGERLHEKWQVGWINDYHLQALERSLVDISNIQGGCERIYNTPIPLSYTIFTHRLVMLYCFFLPLGLIGTVGTATPLVVLLIAYVLHALDFIGAEIEMPFGVDPNDLPLGSICRTIEANLRQTLGETELPPRVQPIRGVIL
ncbi:MAG: hypothetical protein H6728_14875 [Myxococcales bacterium]|nr:hypothetical protein [Myxococcales bacterium]MCB9644353.1 hypothetical protein [Myxococcales bacterium]